VLKGKKATAFFFHVYNNKPPKQQTHLLLLLPLPLLSLLPLLRSRSRRRLHLVPPAQPQAHHARIVHQLVKQHRVARAGQGGQQPQV
jgi:hypothetical protein